MSKNAIGQDHNVMQSALEDVMHESFMPYAEHVILERALPRVEDGLKPVQRRILYTMHELNLSPDAKYKKCARIVGDCMGKYHPHGDSSIYDALVRMAQDFSMRGLLVDGQGNFGTVDGDSAAAMRYTEARMAPLAMELLRDIDKDTVPFGLNFNDEMPEPELLPAGFPNLLVNGATGIAVGLATNIPPHNPVEVIDGVIYRVEHPECSLPEIMTLIKGPDFPTGGVIMGTDDIVAAYTSGRGKIHLRAKTHIEAGEYGKQLIIIDELPFEKKESDTLKKIAELRESKKEMFAGIDEVRSESDRQGLRGVIFVKKGFDAEKLLECLLKYSDLQITYGINIVAIADGQPRRLGLLELLDCFIAFRRDVIKRRTRYDLEKAEEREHIVSGLVTAVLNIDRVIKIIRGSKNTKEAKQNLMAEFDLTGVQAQAILDMRLARLTALEIEALRRELTELQALIKKLTAILGSEKKLDGVLIEEIGEIKKKYNDKRRTAIKAEAGEIKIDVAEYKTIEDCVVIQDRSGGLKRLSAKALGRIADAEPEEKNKPVRILEINTETRLCAFTDRGNMYSFKAEAVREGKYKDGGAALTTFLPGAERGERLLLVEPIPDEGEGEMVFITKSGMIKTTLYSELRVRKTKIAVCGLKPNDHIVYAAPATDKAKLLLVTQNGMSIVFEREGIAPTGRSAKGVGAIKLSPADEVIFAAQVGDDGFVTVVTDAGYMKQSRISEYELQGRNGKGLKTINLLRNAENGTQLAAAFYGTDARIFTAELSSGVQETVSSADVPIEPRHSKGARMFSAILGDVVSKVW